MPWQVSLGGYETDKVSCVHDAAAIYAGANCVLNKIEISTGTILKTADLSGVGQTGSNDLSLVYAPGGLMTPDIIVVGFRGYVFGFDTDLTQLWQVSLPHTYYGAVSLVADGSTVYAGTYGKVFAFDVAAPQGLTENELKHRGYGDVSLALWDDQLLVGINGWVVCLSQLDEGLGTEWQLSLPHCGSAFVEVGTNGDYGFAASAGYLYSFDYGGSLIRTQGLKDTHNRATSLAVSGNWIAAGSNGQTFMYQCVGGDLQWRWTKSMPRNIGTDIPLLATEDLLYASQEGYVYGLDYVDGSIIRSENLLGLGVGTAYMFDVPGGFLAMGNAANLAYSPPAIANFSIQIQEQSNWCWLAGVASVANYYLGRSSWQQCDLANKALEQTSCCIDGSTPNCDQPGYVQDALARTGNRGQEFEASVSLDSLAMELAAARPVFASVYWSSYVGHIYVITGVHPNGDIDIYDPANGSVARENYYIFEQHQPGGGVWGATCFTVPKTRAADKELVMDREVLPDDVVGQIIPYAEELTSLGPRFDWNALPAFATYELAPQAAGDRVEIGAATGAGWTVLLASDDQARPSLLFDVMTMPDRSKRLRAATRGPVVDVLHEVLAGLAKAPERSAGKKGRLLTVPHLRFVGLWLHDPATADGAGAGGTGDVFFPLSATVPGLEPGRETDRNSLEAALHAFSGKQRELAASMGSPARPAR